MHISSLIRSPSRLYYKLWTESNFFHASFSRQRKLHQFHLCMSATVKAAANLIAKFTAIYLSTSLRLPSTSSQHSPQRREPNWSVPFRPLPTQCITRAPLEGEMRVLRLKQTEAHLCAEGRDGAKPWLLRALRHGILLGKKCCFPSL